MQQSPCKISFANITVKDLIIPELTTNANHIEQPLCLEDMHYEMVKAFRLQKQRVEIIEGKNNYSILDSAEEADDAKVSHLTTE